MTIKYTAKDGISISSKNGTAILSDRSIRIVQDDESIEPFEVISPGEYEVADIAIFAYEPYPSFIIEVEQFTFVYLPDPPEVLDEQVASEFERVDILLIPGKRYDLVEQLAPFYVVPLNDPQLLSEKMSSDLPEPTKSLTLKNKIELPEESEVLLLAS